MYVNDPNELSYLPEVRREVILEEPRDYHEFFYDDTAPPSRRYTEDHWGIHTQICRFDDEGNHVTMAENCPHFEVEDEQGPRIQRGWTVQQGG